MNSAGAINPLGVRREAPGETGRARSFLSTKGERSFVEAIRERVARFFRHAKGANNID